MRADVRTGVKGRASSGHSRRTGRPPGCSSGWDRGQTQAGGQGRGWEADRGGGAHLRREPRGGGPGGSQPCRSVHLSADTGTPSTCSSSRFENVDNAIKKATASH